LYNRLGFAVLAPLVVECLVPPRVASRVACAVGGASSGALLVLTCFVKPPFPFVAVLLLGASAVFLPRSRERTYGLAAGATLGLAVWGGMIGYHFAAMFHDYAFVAAARSKSFVWSTGAGLVGDMNRQDPLVTPGRVLDMVLREGWATLTLLALAAIVPLAAFRVRERRRVVALVVVTWVSSMAILAASPHHGGSPMFALLALVLLEYALRSPDARDARARLASVGLAALCAAPFLLASGASLVLDEYTNATTAEASSFPEPQARGLLLEEPRPACPWSFADRTEEVIAAIADIPSPRVTMLDFANPFPFLLGARPPTGGGICWQYDATFSRDHFLPAERMFGDTSVLVFPKCAEDARVAGAIKDLYLPVIRGEFVPYRETRSSLIFRRRSAP
jgi:hypothetical protein